MTFIATAAGPKDSERLSDLKDTIDGTRTVIKSLLARCNIPYPHPIYPQDFDAAVRAEGIRLGYPMEGPQSIGAFVPAAVSMISMAYGHLPNKSTQIFICLYATFFACVDDVYTENIGPVRDFNGRFIRRQPQADKILDGFADLLLQCPDHFNGVVANLITAATLNFMTSLLLEHDTKGMAIGASAQKFPVYSRTMSGCADTFGFLVFPADLPLQSFIQAIPEVTVFLNSGNDIFSFYKEELAGEFTNQVSLMADCRGITKVEALRLLEDEVVSAHDRVVDILAQHEGALDAWLKFRHGYVAFHSLAKRYRLDELEL
ncbi:hypothetical protein PLICRDRAFT_178118 [Plicaturopsis crispa FD-325 SS-3]|nr:hypothetical protein PLICRDRAFT_178118 [Plicaturopsis crispa FD-325 SS-3]